MEIARCVETRGDEHPSSAHRSWPGRKTWNGEIGEIFSEVIRFLRHSRLENLLHLPRPERGVEDEKLVDGAVEIAHHEFGVAAVFGFAPVGDGGGTDDD